MRGLGKSVSALLCGLALVGVGSGAGAADAAVGTAVIGISFVPDGDASQCIGPMQQRAALGFWTVPIRFDTDGRRGGCALSFGIEDAGNSFPGMSFTYRWEPTPGGDAAQCGNSLGTFPIPISTLLRFGPNVEVDTDDRRGGCNLTFTMAGRNDIVLDVQFSASGDPNQCINQVQQDQFRTVSPGIPVTVGIDTDSRPGGCDFALRLRFV